MFLSNVVAVAASFLRACACACVCALFISYTHLFVLDSQQVYLLLFLSLSDLREYSGELLSIVKENVLFIGEFTWEFLWQ